MRLRLILPDEAAPRSWVQAGEPFEPGSPAHIADELRAHVLALGSATRASLVRRVAQLLQPVCAVEEARVDEACRALSRRGDIMGGPGGRVAAAPLRLVEAHGDRLLVIGSLPTVTLRRLLPGAEVSPGVGRTARIPAESRAGLREAIQGIGGRWMPAEEWAGLLRTPHADAAWLEDLAQRLSSEGESSGAALTTRWDDTSVYDPAFDGDPARRWQRRATTETPGLVRAKQAGGWLAYGWGVLRGANELPRPFVGLTRDEGRRTEYALDRAAGRPRSLVVEVDHGLWWVALDPLVPAAEYRFLLAMAEERREDGWPVRLGFTGDAWGRARAMLEERLGILLPASS